MCPMSQNLFIATAYSILYGKRYIADVISNKALRYHLIGQLYMGVERNDKVLM